MERGQIPTALHPRRVTNTEPRGSALHLGSASGDLFPRLTPKIRTALSLLLDAAACAEDAAAERWQFSVELAALCRAGLTTNECRWLVAKGMAKHACETTTHDADRRVFQPCTNLAIPRNACFVITEQGAALANELLQSVPQRRSTDAGPHSRNGHSARLGANDAATQPIAPTWDADRQQLRVGRTIVKQFKVPAANQESILAAFQEDGWPPRIDDPLTPMVNQDCKRRLHDTINSLNRNQKHPLLRFLGDGKGEGVRWEFVSSLTGDVETAAPARCS